MEQDPNLLVTSLLSDLEKSRAITTENVNLSKRMIPFEPWVTHRILWLRDERDRLYREHKKHPNNSVITDHFKKFRNQYRDCIRKADVDYFRRSVDFF